MKKSIALMVKQLGKQFKENNLSLVTAESCTGGGLAYTISKCPECSSILERGYVTYSNVAKENILQVKQASLQLKGAVSEEVSIEMAHGALKNSQAQVSISTTGITGEDLATKNSDQLSGVVWITCVDVFGYQIVKNIKIKGNRNIFLQVIILESLNVLLKYIQHFPR